MAFACSEAHFSHAVTPLRCRSFRAASPILFHPTSREPPRSRDRSPRIFSWHLFLFQVCGVLSECRLSPLRSVRNTALCLRVRPRPSKTCARGALRWRLSVSFSFETCSSSNESGKEIELLGLEGLVAAQQ